jgi:hypothetical protein
MTDTPTPPPQSQNDGDIVAGPGAYHRYARFAIALLFLVYGIWSIRDGFFEYPRANAAAVQAEVDRIRAAREEMGQTLSAEEEARIRAETPQPHGPPDNDLDIPFNQALGIILPPLAVLVVIRTLYRSRGQYRLSGQTLSIPGHPPIPLDAIRRIDKRLWDRKGIAIIDYELPDGRTGRFRLDDFLYKREPTDRILERIEAHMRAQTSDAAPQ